MWSRVARVGWIVKGIQVLVTDAIGIVPTFWSRGRDFFIVRVDAIDFGVDKNWAG